MRFDRNRLLGNLKFYFEIEVISQFKVSILVGGLTLPPGGKYPLGMVIFQDWYPSKKKLVGIDWSLLSASSYTYTHCFSLIGAKF